MTWRWDEEMEQAVRRHPAGQRRRRASMDKDRPRLSVVQSTEPEPAVDQPYDQEQAEIDASRNAWKQAVADDLTVLGWIAWENQEQDT